MGILFDRIAKLLPTDQAADRETLPLERIRDGKRVQIVKLELSRPDRGSVH
jgi:hypothetical protein